MSGPDVVRTDAWSMLVSMLEAEPAAEPGVVELADDAAAEQKHADHEDDAGYDRDRKFRGRQIVLQRHDETRAEERPDQRSDAAEKRHQDDFAGHLPADVGQRRELED